MAVFNETFSESLSAGDGLLHYAKVYTAVDPKYLWSPQTRATLGMAPTGTVFIQNFDQGVVETLGAVVVDNGVNPPGYYLKNLYALDINKEKVKGPSGGVDGPNGYPGVPVIFSYPEDRVQRYKLPMVLVRRDSMEPAMQRWHPASEQYRAPSISARPVRVNLGTTAAPRWVQGWDQYDEQPQAVPYDLNYTIRVISRFRGDSGKTNHVNSLIKHVMGIFQPYSSVYVTDDLGQRRSYSVLTETVGASDESAEIADRVLSFDIALRIEGELDINDPETSFAVTKNPEITLITG